MLKGYPLSSMIQAMDAETIDITRAAILKAALKNPALRKGWFSAKKELDREAEETFQRYQEMMESGLLDEVLEKEVAMDCPSSVHGWLDEWNPNDDVRF